MDCGDYVVVVNAKHVHFTGKKWTQKYYKWHTGWVAGLKQRSAKIMLEKKPEEVMRKAVVRMMKKNSLRARYERRLLIYPEDVHPHAEQNPTEFNAIASQNPTAIPRFSHRLDTDYSLRFDKDPQNDQWTLSARVFKPTAPRAVRQAAKRAGHYGKGHTITPLDSQYPDTFMNGPALTHSEWKRVREMIKTDTKPDSWPVRETTPAIDQFVRAKISLQTNTIRQMLDNPLPKPFPSTPYLTTAEAQEAMKNAPKNPTPAKKK